MMMIPSTRSRAAALLLAVVFLTEGRAADPAPAPTAREIITAVAANQRTSGSRTRARIAVEPADGRPFSLQVVILGRSEGGTNETMIGVLWPRERKGEGWMLRRLPSGAVSGFRQGPEGTAVELRPADADAPLFGSDLAVDDFAETFWDWPDQQLAGEERVDGVECWRVESRPPEGSGRSGWVRSWIAKERPVPLRIEKRAADGAVRKTLTAGRVVKRDDGGWAVAEWTVEAAGEGSRTKVTGSRSDRGLTLDPAQFTPEGLKALVQARGRAED